MGGGETLGPYCCCCCGCWLMVALGPLASDSLLERCNVSSDTHNILALKPRVTGGPGDLLLGPRCSLWRGGESRQHRTPTQTPSSVADKLRARSEKLPLVLTEPQLPPEPGEADLYRETVGMIYDASSMCSQGAGSGLFCASRCAACIKTVITTKKHQRWGKSSRNTPMTEWVRLFGSAHLWPACLSVRLTVCPQGSFASTLAARGGKLTSAPTPPTLRAGPASPHTHRGNDQSVSVSGRASPTPSHDLQLWRRTSTEGFLRCTVFLLPAFASKLLFRYETEKKLNQFSFLMLVEL